jgi:hypothetical protein
LGVSQPQVPGDGQEMNLHLGTGQKLPDTVSGARGKRDRRQSMPLLGKLRSKAIWVEAVRVLP